MRTAHAAARVQRVPTPIARHANQAADPVRRSFGALPLAARGLVADADPGRAATMLATPAEAAEPAEATEPASNGATIGALRRRAAQPSGREAPMTGAASIAALRRRGAAGTTTARGAVIRREPVNLGTDEDEEWIEADSDPETQVEDIANAKAIIQGLQDDYGIEISTPKSKIAIEWEYTLMDRISEIEAGTWTFDELHAVRAAASHYGPILGPKRAASTLADQAQGVTSIGRLEQAISSENHEELDSVTGGQYFSSHPTVRNITFFDAWGSVEDGDEPSEHVREGSDGPDPKTTLEAVAIHEMAHGLIQPHELFHWVDALPFWKDHRTPSGVPDAEAPPTTYGLKSAAEDLCESVATYFINRPKLRERWPTRERFIADVVARWTPEVAANVVDAAANATGSAEPETPTRTNDANALAGSVH